MSFFAGFLRVVRTALFAVLGVFCFYFESMAASTCTGTNFYDEALDACTPCPDGYVYNDSDGKTDISECQIQCPDGKYVEAAGVYGYTPLEYLESPGTAYVNTGFKHKSSNIRGEIRVGTTNDINTNVNIIGNQSQTGGYAVGWDTAFKIWVVSSGNRLSGPEHRLAADKIHDIVYELTDTTRTLTYDGVTVSSTHAGSIQNNTNIHLFDNGQHQTTQNFAARVYYIRLYEDNVLVHNFVPVRRNHDGHVGIFDTVSGRFFENNGDGEFLYGKDLSSKCVNAGAGYYAESAIVNFGDPGVRHACPKGTYSTAETASDISTCTVCPGTAYSDEPGSSSCTDCPLGYNYNPNVGKTSLDQCQIHCESGTRIPSTIPPAYAQLEYIQSTGTQYINTGLYVSNLINPVMSITMQYAASQKGKQSGAEKNSVSFKAGVSNGGKFICQASGANTEISFGNADTQKHTFVLDSGAGTCTFDNTTDNLTVGNLSAIAGTVTIGAVSGAKNRIGNVKFYKFSLISDGHVVRDMVPAMRKTDNAIGMYDKIGNKFYNNAGTGIFEAGPDILSQGTVCVPCEVGNYCAGGVFAPNSADLAVRNCETEIDTGWTSGEGSSVKTDCYYLIGLNKNGFSGTISAGAGNGCSVANTANGTTNASLKLYYNTQCTLPTIDLTQSGFANATTWSTTDAIGAATTTIPAATTTPSVTTYYARKSCPANYYKSGDNACSACGVNSYTVSGNADETCVCNAGYSADGTMNGDTTSLTGCMSIDTGGIHLHVKDKQYKLLPQRRTTPSVCVGIGENVYYVPLVPTEIEHELSVEYENKVYSSCDLTSDYCITNGKLYWADPKLYLQSTGDQHIDTGVVPDLNTAIEIEMADVSNLTYGLFGVKTDTLATTDTGFGISLSDGKFGFFRNGTSVSAISKDNQYHVYYLSNTSASIDGVAYNFAPASSPINAQRTMYMYGFNHNGTAVDKSISIKYLKIWSGDTLVRHFVPVPQGLVIGNYTVPKNGMFDIVNQTFYEATGGLGNLQYGKIQ